MHPIFRAAAGFSRPAIHLLLFLGIQGNLHARYEAVPVCRQWDPLELLAWSPEFDPDSSFARASVPLAPRFTAWNVNPEARSGEARVETVSTFNTIPAGATHGWPTTRLYAPGMWQYTDHLVFWGSSDRDTKTILTPTAHVIDAAHRNGVPVLGKIFFRWNSSPDPVTLQKFRDLLVRDGGTFPVADRLVESAVYFGFDGWFINQENYQTNADDAADMRDFLVYFRQSAAAAGAPHLRIVWYDAMAENGSRSFQNALTANNDGYLITPGGQPVAHAMFMNFWWYYNATNLASSRARALSLGLDPYDLHAGIWTENNRTYGNTPDPNGGGNIAIPWSYVFPENQPHHVSVALFGAETPFFKGKNPAATAVQEELYWSGPHRDPTRTTATAALPNWHGMARHIPARSAVTALPFVTHFNTGQGHFFNRSGETMMTGPWTNLSLQDILPTWRWIATGGGTITPSLDFTDAWRGGSSLKLSGALAAGDPREVKLYQTQLPMTPAATLGVTCRSDAADGAALRLGYAFEDAPLVMHYTAPVAAAAGWTSAEFPLGHHAGRTIALLTLRLESAADISAHTTRIGRLALTDGPAAPPAPPDGVIVESAAANPDEAFATRLRIRWNASPDPVRHYDIYQRATPGGPRAWIGATPQTRFFAQDVRRISAEPGATVEVEAVGADFAASAAAAAAQTFIYQPRPNLHHPLEPGDGISIIGSGSAANLARAFDGDTATHTEPGGADGAWVGLDLGAGNATGIVAIQYAPRNNWVSRIVNGVFQGSDDPSFASGVVELGRVVAPPPEGVATTLAVSQSGSFRCLRYLSPPGGYANLSELAFFAAGAPVPPQPPVALQGTSDGGSARLSWVAPPGVVHGYRVRRANSPGGPFHEIAGVLTDTSCVDTGLSAETPVFYQVTAWNEAGESPAAGVLTIHPPAAWKMTGTVIGAGTPYGSNGYAKAFDGRLDTYFETTQASGWVGLDLGAGNTKVPAAIRYSPRNSNPAASTNAEFMIGGRFQAANLPDFSDAVTLFTIPGPPAYQTLTSVAFEAPATPFRYIRYLTAAGRNANIAEFEIHAAPADGYAAWIEEAGILTNTGFADHSEGSGVANGVRYMNPDGPRIAAGPVGATFAAAVRIDPAVGTSLWISSDLSTWTETAFHEAADQTGSPAGFVRIEAVVPPAPGGAPRFLQLRFTR